MSEDTNAGANNGSGIQGGNSGGGSTGPGGTTPSPSPADGGGTNPNEQQSNTRQPKVWTLDEAVAEIGKLRGEAASHRTRATTAETERDQLRVAVATLSQDRDTIRAERDQLQETRRAAEILEMATAAASEAHAINPGGVAKLIRAADVQWDDKGKAKNIPALVEAIKRDFPTLFRAGGADGGTAGHGTGEADPGYGPARLTYAYSKSGGQERRR